MKFCKYCNQDKPLSDFPSYQTHRCRSCIAQERRERREANKTNGICSCGSPTFNNTYLCETCYTKQRIRSSRARVNVKDKAVKYLGGKCLDCGFVTSYAVVYDFHHRDPAKKDFGIASCRGRSFESLKSELEKCDLLCSNCHRIRHWVQGTAEADKTVP